jgi:RimJ/RimL family protein N-acetyltransferase
MSLVTSRLALRQFTLEDAPFVVALLNSPGWLRFIGDRGVRDEASARAYLERGVLPSYAAHGFGLYHVSRRADGLPVGMCGLLRRDYLADVDVGFAFLPEHSGQGYATECAQRMVTHSREDFRLQQLAGIVQAENAASIRVLEKIGLREVGPLTLPSGTTVQLYRGMI